MSKKRVLLFLVLNSLLLPTIAHGQTTYPYAINTLAGSGTMGDGGPATASLLEYPQSVAVDSTGKVYIGDSGNGRIRVVNSDGTIQTFAFGVAASMKMDSAGNLYASDGAYRIYKISPKGVITVFAGAGVGYSGDNGPAVSAKFAGVMGVAVDALNNVYLADTYNQVVRKITPDGIVHTIAGNGTAAYGKEHIAAISSPLAYPTGVEVDAAGNLYISELYRIREVNTDGTINTIAGNGSSAVDGLAINSAIGSMVALAVDKQSNLYLADADYSMVRMISPAGRITTLAGSGSPGFGGDGSYAFRALLDAPMGVAVDAQGDVFIADELNQRIRELNAAGMMSTVAGALHYGGDGGPATTALLHRPEQAIKDSAGNLFISDTANHRIRKVDTKGAITTIAGTGDCNYGGDLGKATAATLCLPEGLAFDQSGNLYVADWGNYVVRRIDTKGVITTVVGSGNYGDVNSGSPTAAKLEGPYGLAFDAQGNLYISDSVTNRVLFLSLASHNSQYPNGTLSPFAGTGTSGSTGDGGLSTSAKLNGPTHLAVGLDGSVYIADYGNDRVRKVAFTQSPGNPGIIGTVIGAQNCCAARTEAAVTSLAGPDGITVDASGNLFVAWQNSDVITATTPTGRTSIIAGTGADDFSGDGGLAPDATFSGPAGLFQDAAGDFYVSDFFNSRIRKLTLDTLTGMSVSSGDNQSADTRTALKNPLVVVLNFRGGVGIPGIPVTFAVTSGTATLSLQSTTTDALGQAGVGVTMGDAPGPVVITASAAGAAAVQFHLTATSGVPLPTIAAGSGIIGAGMSTPPILQISPGGFATIMGTNFAPEGTYAQPQSNTWPTILGGVCVLIDGQSAFLTFVSPTQINLQVPNVPVNTTVNVQVISNCGTAGALQSATQPVQTLNATPEFLYWVRNADGHNPVVAVNINTGAYTGAAGLIPGVNFVPAKPGDNLTIYGVSFGPTNPPAIPGRPSDAAASSIYNDSVKLGGVTLDPTAVFYAGITPGSPGLYQLNIQVPNVPDGDYPLVLTLGAFSTPASGFLTVKH